ncbi:hypothetical protein KCP77_01960 [Salmonella enterica subsp. enterica]|nr:hypothetical protein KCP77_01960 [Salmonella enterica subsp. enterica]
MPLAAIVARRVDNRCRTRRRVTPAPRPLPADTPVCGARAGVGRRAGGRLIALAVGRRLRPDHGESYPGSVRHGGRR